MKKSGYQVKMLILIAFLLTSVNVFSEVLYESTSLNSSGGVLNTTSWPSLNDGVIIVDDITVPAGSWTINTISNYFSVIGTPEVDSAFFFVYLKSLGNVNPMEYAVSVPVEINTETFIDPNNNESRLTYRISASGLNINLQPGEYWIGLSPIADSYATNWMAWGSSEAHGELARCYDLLQQAWVGLAFWTGPDYMMKIEGNVSSATTDLTYSKPNFGSLSNYPNPFNPSTTISFELFTSSQVNLEIYNQKGQKVKSIINQSLNIGKHQFVWNGSDNNGKKVSSGVYFCKLVTGSSSIMKKMIMIK